MTHHFMLNEMNDHLDRTIQDYLVQNTICNWSTYKVGKYAASQGSWSVAAFAFDSLKTIVMSKASYLWLKSLEQLAQSEMKIQFLFPPKQVEWKIKLHENMDRLIGALNGIQSSRESLRTIETSHGVFSFQRWFISIRQRILECTLDILKLCGDYEIQVEKNMQISFRLLKIARELDLITSFLSLEMNKRNLEIFQALALSCSMLAFTTGFSLSYSNINDGSENLDNLNGTLVHDLFCRLELVEGEATKELGSLLRIYGPTKCFSFLHSRNRVSSSNGDAKGLLKICGDAVTAVVGMVFKTNPGNDGTSRQIPSDGLQLLLDTIAKWMHIPFRMPKRFFQMRPFISCELFASSSTKYQEEISVKQGFHLSLNLCIQLKNIPDNSSFRLTKLYCILQCKSSSRVLNRHSEENMEVDGPEYEADDMVDLNNKLFQHIVNESNRNSGESNKKKSDDEDVFIVETVVSFEPNESGIGFSTCLFDVSNFGVGFYRIKWHSCCLDNEDSCWSLFPLNSALDFTVVQEINQ
ncbi:uncharacterized protein LOC124912126 [Impatiens glandulifera]|uniref:uncharacterized protein LOC124912126 n=1 Tax=Impatiens glandulifera TaxID=253017 RepID=UPI001FB0E820|nr:uncharacterized protein LOC124912126 [Impatiens glandulifera]